MTKHSTIHYLKALADAGILTDINTISRVTIELPCGGVPTVTVEHVADERLEPLLSQLPEVMS